MTSRTCWALGISEEAALDGLEDGGRFPSPEEAASAAVTVSEVAGSPVKVFKITIVAEEATS